MTSLTLVRRIKARPEIVFDALATPDGIAHWWGPDAGFRHARFHFSSPISSTSSSSSGGSVSAVTPYRTPASHAKNTPIT